MYTVYEREDYKGTYSSKHPTLEDEPRLAVVTTVESDNDQASSSSGGVEVVSVSHEKPSQE
eukprot:2677916-Rhodomonas_salina.1